MTTIAIYFACFFFFVAFTMLVPGLNTIITPVWAGLGRGILLAVSWAWGWIVFTVKGVTSAHSELVRNLIYSEEDMDIRKKMKK